MATKLYKCDWMDTSHMDEMEHFYIFNNLPGEKGRPMCTLHMTHDMCMENSVAHSIGLIECNGSGSVRFIYGLHSGQVITEQRVNRMK